MNIYMEAKKKLKEAKCEEEIGQVSAMLEKVPEQYMTGDMAILRSIALRLGPDDPLEENPMENIQKLLETSVVMNPDSIEYNFELGVFWDVCMLEPQKALIYLERARELCKKSMREITEACDEVLKELTEGKSCMD